MATVNVVYFRPSTIGESAAVIDPADAVSQNFTSSGSSQVTTGSATVDNNYIRVTATGGNVYLAFGLAPTAVTATGFLLLDGTTEVFHVADNWKVALID